VRPPLQVAAAQPPCAANDVRGNAHAHAAAIRSAEARVVVFPELSLTGYELDADPVSTGDAALRPIAEACCETGTIALAGAPVEGTAGELHIATLRFDGQLVDVLYRKAHLGGDEPARFTPGNGAVAIDVDGWRIGVGICKDTGVEQHVTEVAGLGVDAYVAGLVHRPDERGVQDERGVRIARVCRCYVAFASFAGPTGGGYEETAGLSTIWAPNGTVLARAGAEPGGLAAARLA
jgi:predicted amidohydrolase